VNHYFNDISTSHTEVISVAKNFFLGVVTKHFIFLAARTFFWLQEISSS